MTVVVCFHLDFLPKPFIKIKTKQNNNKNTFSAQSGATGCQRLGKHPGSHNLNQHWEYSRVCLFGGLRSMKCCVEGSAAGRSSVTRSRLRARAGRVSDIVFPFIEVSGPNSWKIGWAGSPCRGFHWAPQCGGVTWMQDPQPKKEGRSWAPGTVSLQECVGIWNGLGVNMCTGVIRGEKRRKKSNLFLQMTLLKWTLFVAHTLKFQRARSPNRPWFNSTWGKRSSQNLGFYDIISTVI